MRAVRWNISLESQEWRGSDSYQQAVQFLKKGLLVAIPTETVYGLAADATNGEACARIFEAKGRPKFNPLISHVWNYDVARENARFDSNAVRLAERFWPGPLTLVLPKSNASRISALCTSGLDTVAIRVPDAPVMQALSEDTGCPLAAPSANSSGGISPTTGLDVLDDLGDRVAMVIDSGRTEIGLESTVVSCIDGNAVLLRPGGIPTAELEDELDFSLSRSASDDTSPSSPGMLTSHYAPDSQVRLNADSVKPDETLLAFGSPLPDGADDCIGIFNLSRTSDMIEAGSRLFEGLRKLDAISSGVIAVMPIPNHGIGEAINDRLTRASAPRKPTV